MPAKLILLWQHWARFAARRPTGAALLTVPGLFVLMVLLFRPGFETNDDAGMQLIASGRGLVDTPDEHLIFTSPLIGLMLRELYLAAPEVPWYGLYLLGTQLLAHILLSRLLWMSFSAGRATLLGAAWLLFVGAHHLIHLQFTSTAFLIGATSLLTGWRALAGQLTHGHLAKREPVIAVAGLWLALLIRWYTFEMLLVVGSFSLLLWLVFARASRTVWLTAIGCFAVCTAGGTALKTWHISYYHNDPAWNDFYSFNELRAQFNDLGNVPYNTHTAPVLQQHGWSTNDLTLLMTWNYDDPELFSAARMQSIWNDVRALPIKHNWTWFRDRLQPLQVYDSRILPAYLGLLCGLIWAGLHDRRLLLFHLCQVTFIALLIAVLAIVRKAPPPRVFLPLLLWANLAFLAMWAWLPRTAPRLVQQWLPGIITRRALFNVRLTTATRVIGYVCVLITTLVTIRNARVLYKIGKQNYAASSVLAAQFDRLASEPQRLWICWGATMPFEQISPLRPIAALKTVRLTNLGWFQQTPLHRRRLEQFGMRAVLPDLPRCPDARLLCEPVCGDLLTRYYQEHRGETRPLELTGAFGVKPIFALVADPSAAADATLTRQPSESGKTR